MNQVQLSLLVCLLSCPYGLTAPNPTTVTSTPNATSQRDVSDDAFPIGSSPGRGSPKRLVYASENRGKTVIFSSPSSPENGGYSSRPSCLPQLYRVRVGSAACSQTVITKVSPIYTWCAFCRKEHIQNDTLHAWFFRQMCYGECPSYTSPSKINFSKAKAALAGFRSTCKCCSAVRKSTRRHEVRCPGEKMRKTTFYVPFAERCTCRPCTQY